VTLGQAIDEMSRKVIVSLDFDTEREALALVQTLGDAADHYKIGIQTLTAAGPSLARALVEQGKHVFLDLKLHEIPTSVASAVRMAGKLGVSMVTVHASAGSAVLCAAVDAARPFHGLSVLALTVITSLSDRDLPEVGLPPSVESQVNRLASLAWAAGCDGVVASAQEASVLRLGMPPAAIIVCPGIQLPDSGKTDQARTATPRAAALSGATHIVVGRAVAAAARPLEAFREIASEFENEG
jgi:orotidine-5'-phosphate decarboxylase